MLSVVNVGKPEMVDLCDVMLSVDDTQLVKGLVFDDKVSHVATCLIRMENAKIAYPKPKAPPPPLPSPTTHPHCPSPFPPSTTHASLVPI
ncbi:hypothetical protein Fmac_009550 [Flemingia macrophylla]|uniref:Uncharacterized protein n=1 Tax=Flemingia macrophylla TaxID=520843 RepID=A0ABD1N0J8_9FABA